MQQQVVSRVLGLVNDELARLSALAREYAAELQVAEARAEELRQKHAALREEISTLERVAAAARGDVQFMVSSDPGALSASPEAVSAAAAAATIADAGDLAKRYFNAYYVSSAPTPRWTHADMIDAVLTSAAEQGIELNGRGIHAHMLIRFAGEGVPPLHVVQTVLSDKYLKRGWKRRLGQGNVYLYTKAPMTSAVQEGEADEAATG